MEVKINPAKHTSATPCIITRAFINLLPYLSFALFPFPIVMIPAMSVASVSPIAMSIAIKKNVFMAIKINESCHLGSIYFLCDALMK